MKRMMDLMRRGALLGLFGVLVGFVCPSSSAERPDDAYAFRVEHGKRAAEAEIARLEAGRPKHEVDEQLAQRLAGLTIAAEAPSREAYREGMRRLAAERRRALADVQAVLAGGPYKTDWLNSRWLNAMPSARGQDAKELYRRVFADQMHVATSLEGAEAKAFSYLLHVDNERLIRANAEWLKAVLRRIGWFDMSRYGAEASQGAWLLVQHADYDPAFQRAMLERLAGKVRTGDMQGNYYAYLVDRVATNAGEPQTYGTQGRCVPGEMRWEPLAIDSPEDLDRRRAAVGLEPMAAYRARFRCR